MSDFEVRQGGKGGKADLPGNGRAGHARADARDMVPQGAVVKVSTRKHVDATDLVPKGTVVKVPTRRVVDASDLVPQDLEVRMGGTLDPSPKPAPTKARTPVHVRKDAPTTRAKAARAKETPVQVRKDVATPAAPAPREAAKVKVVMPATAKARPAPPVDDFEVVPRSRKVRAPPTVDLGTVEIVPPGHRPDGTPHGAEPRPAEVTVKKPKRRTAPKFLRSVMETLEIKPRRRRKADTSDMVQKGDPQVTLDTDSVWTPENMRKSSKRKK